MNNTEQLHDMGQRLWLATIARAYLDDGRIQRYIRDYAVCGLSCDPSAFEQAVASGAAYDRDIREKLASGVSGEALLDELALADACRAADLLQPLFRDTDGIDGWVAMALSPLLARDALASIVAAARMHRQAARANVMVTIPGTAEGLAAVEELIFGAIPVNVSLLFSPAQYLAAAGAYIRGLQRRVAAGLDARVGSVASLSINRWDRVVVDTVAPALRNQLGISVARRSYRVYRELLTSVPWRQLDALGARAQRLLWADTASEDATLPGAWYVQALAAPDTIDAVTERTLLNFAVHGKLQGAQAADAGKAEAALARFGRSGVEVDALAQRLQDEGLQAHTTSWQQLLERVALVGGLPAALPGVSPSQSGRTDTGAPATETAKA